MSAVEVWVEDQARCLTNRTFKLNPSLSKSSIHNLQDNSNNICRQDPDLIITRLHSPTTMTSSNLWMIERVNKTGKMMALVTIKHRLVAAAEITAAISHVVVAVLREGAVAAWATSNSKHHSHFHNTRQVEMPPQREEDTRIVVLVVIMVVVVEDVAAKVITTITMTDMT